MTWLHVLVTVILSVVVVCADSVEHGNGAMSRQGHAALLRSGLNGWYTDGAVGTGGALWNVLPYRRTNVGFMPKHRRVGFLGQGEHPNSPASNTREHDNDWFHSESDIDSGYGQNWMDGQYTDSDQDWSMYHPIREHDNEKTWHRSQASWQQDD